MALTGSETLQVLGQNPAGVPAATTFQTTTGAIAALAALESATNTLTTISTVGAGSLTAASIIGRNISRTGTQTAGFTDTTVAASALIAALPSGAAIGTSFQVTYQNNTTGAGAYPATIAGGSGVTVSGQTVVAPQSWVRYLLTYTAANTVTMVAVEQGFVTSHSGTIVNNGVTAVTTADANVTPSSNIIITLQTVGGTVGAIPHLATVTPGTGFTTVGTASDTSTYSYIILG